MSEAPASIIALTVIFHLDGCRSLKERRGRLGGLRERFGRNPRIALVEHPGDDPQASRWTFLILGQDPRATADLADGVARDLEMRVDAVVADFVREIL
ncbi:MAG TPA: DUF503 family protein [Pseudomonadales bacterium]|nr:DUF503 family protein [Pseudomonadales bacterium]